MTKLTTERLEEMRDHYLGMVNKDVGNALTRLLAYEQAAKNPVAWIVHMRTGDQFTTDGDFVGLGEAMHGIHSTPLYAAPVLPKQPESRNEIMAKGVEAFAKDWKGSARYSRISEMACNFAAKLRNGDADEC